MTALAPYMALAERAAAALPVAGLRSVYLIGSLARGSFTPGLSDIDLLAFADDAPTQAFTVYARDPDAALSVCVRPTSQLFDPFAPLRWSGQPAIRTQKELTAVSDLMFLCDHGRLLRGTELRALCVLPAREAYRSFLQWEAAVAARGALIPGIARYPRRAAKRIMTLLRDLHFLRTGAVGVGADELVAGVEPASRDAARSALWLSGIRARREDDARASTRVMDYRDSVFAPPHGWPQLADLQSTSFQLCGVGECGFADAWPAQDSNVQ